HGLAKVIAAGHEEKQVGIDVGDGVPARLASRLAVMAEQVPAARPSDLVGHPVANGERRVEPLEANDARTAEPALAPSLGGRLDRLQALAEPLDQLDGRVL